MITKQQNKWRITFFMAGIIMIVGIAFSAVGAWGATDTSNPTITTVSPGNNEQMTEKSELVTVTFSKQVNPATVNTETFFLTQRTTPDSGSPAIEYRSLPIAGKVISDGYTAMFIPTSPLQPSQKNGNVYTVTLTPGIKDFAGNALARNYMWSFTSGSEQFNQGTTTMQLDQSANSNQLVSVAPTAAVPVPATTPVQTQGTTTSFPYGWVIGGLLLLAAIVAVVVFSRKETKSNTTIIAATESSDPFGDTYPVIQLEGIGPEYNSRLQAMGIENTHQLWKANAAKVAKETGAPLLTVHNWQDMAELSSIKGIGPQYAELLERSGIHSVEQLKNADTDKLLASVRKKQNSLKINIQGNHPGHAMVEHWIEQAQAHKGSAA